MKYAIVLNTGKGFYTYEDRKNIPNFRICNDIAILTDNLKAAEWIQKVKGKEITKQEALVKLEEQFDTGKTNNITRLQQDLANEQAKSFDPSSFDMMVI